TQGEATMFAGTGVQLDTVNRWGDYTAMCLDPADDATFWYTNEYYNPTGTFLWKTKIGAFKFDGTTAPPQGTLSGTITACDTGAPLKHALIHVAGVKRNEIIEPNECNELDVTILNDGCLLGSNVKGRLSTTTPGVTITRK